MKHLRIRIGKFDLTVTVCWSSVSYPFGIIPWKYYGTPSWRHGCAYLGRLKVIW